MYFFFIISALLVFFSSQPLLVIYSLAILFILYKIFWKPGEPKVIFIALAYFWSSITVKIFYADIVGLNYEDLSISPKIIETTFISLLCLVVFSFGLFFTSRNRLKNLYVSSTDSLGYKVNNVAIFYIISTVVSITLKGVLFVIPSLSQLLNAIVQVKLGLTFMLCHVIYVQKKPMWLLYVILGVEILLSFVSFFSSFKDILITIVIVFSFYPYKLSFKQYVRNSIAAIGIIYLLLIWQTIKGEYRFFLNQGTQSQAILVNTNDALTKIWDLAKDANPFDKDNDVVYQSIDRLSYIEFFSQATVRVPFEVSYENGDLWLANVMHVLVPRIINPDKKAIDDSKMVNQYCMRQVATAEIGTTFSLGFMAESYIDFGPYFMYIPIFLVGCLFGWIYKYILQNSINFIWGFSMVCSLWAYISCNGTPGSKILGWLFMYFIAFYLIKRFLMKPIDRYLKGNIVASEE